MKLEPKLQGLRVYIKIGEYCISVWTIWAGTDRCGLANSLTHTYTHEPNFLELTLNLSRM